jgi:hypothetical protein
VELGLGETAYDQRENMKAKRRRRGLAVLTDVPGIQESKKSSNDKQIVELCKRHIVRVAVNYEYCAVPRRDWRLRGQLGDGGQGWEDASAEGTREFERGCE